MYIFAMQIGRLILSLMHRPESKTIKPAEVAEPVEIAEPAEITEPAVRSVSISSVSCLGCGGEFADNADLTAHHCGLKEDPLSERDEDEVKVVYTRSSANAKLERPAKHFTARNKKAWARFHEKHYVSVEPIP